MIYARKKLAMIKDKTKKEMCLLVFFMIFSVVQGAFLRTRCCAASPSMAYFHENSLRANPSAEQPAKRCCEQNDEHDKCDHR